MSRHPLIVVLTGHLTSEALNAALLEPAAALESSPAALIVDCRDMDGYDTGARETFVNWNRTWRHRITRVAVITDKTLWHVVVSAMALASSQQMKAFRSAEEAELWANGGVPQ